jgi:hypothetical protein
MARERLRRRARAITGSDEAPGKASSRAWTTRTGIPPSPGLTALAAQDEQKGLEPERDSLYIRGPARSSGFGRVPRPWPEVPRTLGLSGSLLPEAGLIFGQVKARKGCVGGGFMGRGSGIEGWRGEVRAAVRGSGVLVAVMGRRLCWRRGVRSRLDRARGSSRSPLRAPAGGARRVRGSCCAGRPACGGRPCAVMPWSRTPAAFQVRPGVQVGPGGGGGRSN